MKGFYQTEFGKHAFEMGINYHLINWMLKYQHKMNCALNVREFLGIIYLFVCRFEALRACDLHVHYL